MLNFGLAATIHWTELLDSSFFIVFSCLLSPDLTRISILETDTIHHET